MPISTKSKWQGRPIQIEWVDMDEPSIAHALWLDTQTEFTQLELEMFPYTSAFDRAEQQLKEYLDEDPLD